MSRTISLFVIVEGRNHDRFLVEQLCGSSPILVDRGYEIRTVGQVLGDTDLGGKAATLGLYTHAKKSSKLAQKNSRGTRSIAFVLDRDSQHLTGGRKRSAHVVYTTYADGESQSFHASDEVGAIANAASMDRASAESLVRHLGDWKKQLASDWRAWIELCYLAEATQARCWVGFSHESSKVHTGQVVRTVKADALKAGEAAVKSTSPLSERQFQAIKQRLMDKIDAVYRAGNQSTLLSGKWLPRQLSILVSHTCNRTGLAWHSDGFRESVTRCYLAHLETQRTANRRMVRRLEDLTM